MMKVKEILKILEKAFLNKRELIMYKYLIIIEKTKTGYSAYCPDLPGCVAAASIIDKTESLMKEAMEFHIEGMLEEGLEIPRPTLKKAGFVKIDYKRKIKNRPVVLSN